MPLPENPIVSPTFQRSDEAGCEIETVGAELPTLTVRWASSVSPSKSVTRSRTVTGPTAV